MKLSLLVLLACHSAVVLVHGITPEVDHGLVRRAADPFAAPEEPAGGCGDEVENVGPDVMCMPKDENPADGLEEEDTKNLGEEKRRQAILAEDENDEIDEIENVGEADEDDDMEHVNEVIEDVKAVDEVNDGNNEVDKINHGVGDQAGEDFEDINIVDEGGFPIQGSFLGDSVAEQAITLKGMDRMPLELQAIGGERLLTLLRTFLRLNAPAISGRAIIDPPLDRIQSIDDSWREAIRITANRRTTSTGLLSYGARWPDYDTGLRAQSVHPYPEVMDHFLITDAFNDGGMERDLIMLLYSQDCRNCRFSLAVFKKVHRQLYIELGQDTKWSNRVIMGSLDTSRSDTHHIIELIKPSRYPCIVHISVTGFITRYYDDPKDETSIANWINHQAMPLWYFGYGMETVEDANNRQRQEHIVIPTRKMLMDRSSDAQIRRWKHFLHHKYATDRIMFVLVLDDDSVGRSADFHGQHVASRDRSNELDLGVTDPLEFLEVFGALSIHAAAFAEFSVTSQSGIEVMFNTDRGADSRITAPALLALGDGTVKGANLESADQVAFMIVEGFKKSNSENDNVANDPRHPNIRSGVQLERLSHMGLLPLLPEWTSLTHALMFDSSLTDATGAHGANTLGSHKPGSVQQTVDSLTGMMGYLPQHLQKLRRDRGNDAAPADDQGLVYVENDPIDALLVVLCNRHVHHAFNASIHVKDLQQADDVSGPLLSAVAMMRVVWEAAKERAERTVQGTMAKTGVRIVWLDVERYPSIVTQILGLPPGVLDALEDEDQEIYSPDDGEGEDQAAEDHGNVPLLVVGANPALLNLHGYINPDETASARTRSNIFGSTAPLVTILGGVGRPWGTAAPGPAPSFGYLQDQLDRILENPKSAMAEIMRNAPYSGGQSWAPGSKQAGDTEIRAIPPTNWDNSLSWVIGALGVTFWRLLIFVVVACLLIVVDFLLSTLGRMSMSVLPLVNNDNIKKD
eukprot:Clim_evm22s203 gene=Clim_evmTU22s203